MIMYFVLKKSCDLQQEHHHIRVIESDTKWHGPETKEAPPLWLWKPKAVFPTSRPLENTTNWMTRSYMSFLKNPTQQPKQGTIKGQNPLKLPYITLFDSSKMGHLPFLMVQWENDPSLYRKPSFSGAPISIPPWIWEEVTPSASHLVAERLWCCKARGLRRNRQATELEVRHGDGIRYPNWKYPT